MLLKKISLKNYMGAENVEVDFSEKTEIRGKNRCGKSTLINAYFDVMTGKFANGAAPNNICPVDENGEVTDCDLDRIAAVDEESGYFGNQWN